MLCSPSDSHSDDMHMQLLHAHVSTCRTAPFTFHRMQLLHAHSAHANAPCTFSTCMYSLRLPHNVMHSPSYVIPMEGKGNAPLVSTLMVFPIKISYPSAVIITVATVQRLCSYMVITVMPTPTAAVPTLCFCVETWFQATSGRLQYAIWGGKGWEICHCVR